MAENKIKALFIFEVMGRPPEHLKEALDKYIDQLGENKGIEITRREIHDPKPVEKEGAEGLFTTFSEVEVVVEELNLIFEIVLNMLPAHAEILEPEDLRLKNFDLSSIISNLSIKLHKYDEVAKTITMERNILMKRLQEMQIKINDLEGSIKKPKSKKSNKKKPAKKPSKKKTNKKK